MYLSEMFNKLLFQVNRFPRNIKIFLLIISDIFIAWISLFISYKLSVLSLNRIQSVDIDGFTYVIIKSVPFFSLSNLDFDSFLFHPINSSNLFIHLKN